MKKEHSSREETCCCHYMGHFVISSKGAFIGQHIPAFVIPVVDHWLERDYFMHVCLVALSLRGTDDDLLQI